MPSHPLELQNGWAKHMMWQNMKINKLMAVFMLPGLLHDFVDFHILPQRIFSHPFCNLKQWLVRASEF